MALFEGLKISRWQHRAGSIPALGTIHLIVLYIKYLYAIVVCDHGVTIQIYINLYSFKTPMYL